MNNSILIAKLGRYKHLENKQYFEAGSDIIENNTFTGTWVTQANYTLESEIAKKTTEDALKPTELIDAHTAQSWAPLDEGVDLLDTDNSKTTLYIIQLLGEEHDEVLVVVPDTNVDGNGKIPSLHFGVPPVINICHTKQKSSGHYGEALVIRIFYAKPEHVDVNRVLGDLEARPFRG